MAVLASKGTASVTLAIGETLNVLAGGQGVAVLKGGASKGQSVELGASVRKIGPFPFAMPITINSQNGAITYYVGADSAAPHVDIEGEYDAETGNAVLDDPSREVLTDSGALWPASTYIGELLKDTTGLVNQRDQIEAAMIASAASDQILVIDRVVQVDATGGNEIYIPNGLKMKFVGAGRIDGLWDTNPLFIALHANFEISDLDVLYIGPGLVAATNYNTSPGSDAGFDANGRLKTRMQTYHGNTFSGAGRPVWYGPHAFMAGLMVLGQSSGTLTGKTRFRSPSSATADNFIPWVIAGKGQWNPNVTGITSTTGTLTPDASISQPSLVIEDLFVDGAIMGIQGEFSRLDVKRTRSYRYTDLMAADGSLIGGVAGNGVPPPHLFYINERNDHINIIDTIDYGLWVTNNADPKARRDPAVGSCCSLKVGAQRGGVNGYKSYRPDGFADVLGDQSGYGQSAYTIENFYAEYDSTVCGSQFPSIRFPSPPYIGTTIQNGKLVDTATQTTIAVLGYNTDANNRRITVQNVEVEMQDFGGTNYPGCYFNGSGHSVDVRYRFKAHSATQTARGVIAYQGAAGTGVAASRHRAEVIGWRGFTSDVSGLKNRIIMDGGSGGTNSNMNVAELVDVTNGHTATQYGGFKRERWAQKAIIPSAAGATITTALKIPANWSVVEVASGPKVSLGTTSGLTGYTVGWSGTPAGLGTVTGATTSARLASGATVASTGSDRTVVLTATGGNFDATGTIELVFTCEIVSMGE